MISRKETANKHLNLLLGKDPRWLRPRDIAEQRMRIDALKNSSRARDAFQLDTNRDPEPHFLPGPDKDSAAADGDQVEWPETVWSDHRCNGDRTAFQDLNNKLRNIDRYTQADVKDTFRVLRCFSISGMDDCNYQSWLYAPIRTDDATDHGHPTFLLPGDCIHTNLSDYEATATVDQMGNTSLHLVASSNEQWDKLIEMLSADDWKCLARLNAINTGGQTWMHLLHDSWFEPRSPLERLVDVMKAAGFNFGATDSYGRTVFHIFEQKLDNGRMSDILSRFGPEEHGILNRRDAFGSQPWLQMAVRDRADFVRRPSVIPTRTEVDERFIRHHIQLLDLINQACLDPGATTREDSQGQNALHCLAEVVLGTAAIEACANGTSPSRHRRNEKKIQRQCSVDDVDDFLPQYLPFTRRIQYLQTVLQAGVDVNHYDAKGNTVLMSYTYYHEDGLCYKDVEALIKPLIEAGAKIEARNRDGETALQFAANLGNMFVVRVFLELGANPQVRDCYGRSILESVDQSLHLFYDNEEQVARLEATRSILTGRFNQFRVVQNPTIMQE